jgi:DNA-binding PadR family transcriptional regulator
MFSKQEPPIQKESSLENMIKKHLEMIVISMVRKQPMCGRDIVMEVFRQYKVLVSQSSVYVVLYSLKEKNILEASTIKGDMRSKVYIPTERGREMISEMLDEFVSSVEYLHIVLKENTISKKKP